MLQNDRQTLKEECPSLSSPDTELILRPKSFKRFEADRFIGPSILLLSLLLLLRLLKTDCRTSNSHITGLIQGRNFDQFRRRTRRGRPWVPRDERGGERGGRIPPHPTWDLEEHRELPSGIRPKTVLL